MMAAAACSLYSPAVLAQRRYSPSVLIQRGTRSAPDQPGTTQAKAVRAAKEHND